MVASFKLSLLFGNLYALCGQLMCALLATNHMQTKVNYKLSIKQSQKTLEHKDLNH